MALEPTPVDTTTIDHLFRDARTHYAWTPRPVPDELLREIYDIAKWGPTAANSSPMRVLYIKSDEAKARLLPTLSPGNVEKARTAAAVAIIAYDTEFYEKLPTLAPQADFRSYFAGNDEVIHKTGVLNSALQGGYFIIAARALGLDCGPMGGFDADKLNEEFFPDGKWKVNFICNLGYGDREKLFPRNPRLSFDEAAAIL